MLFARLTEDKSKADLWILNSCTVKNPAEAHFRNDVDVGIAQGRKVVVSGCVPQGRPDSKYIKGLSIIGVQQIDRVVEVVEETLKGNQTGGLGKIDYFIGKFELSIRRELKRLRDPLLPQTVTIEVRLLGAKRVQIDSPEELGIDKKVKKAGGANLALPKVRRNPLVEIIAISTGCLNQCTYCKTKHARGELGSYPIKEIVARAEQSFQEGVIEIWLTSEDTGAYGRDIGVTLPDLLWRLVEVTPDNCRLRLGMTNPPYILDYLDEMAQILNHPRVYKFLHLPVQSGSDAVLSDMKREYTRNHFCNVVDYLRKEVPGITIATDIICGFPTETEEDFEDTVALCKKYKFPTLFINQFYSRPGTPAAKMKAIPTQDVKQRTKSLTDFFYSYVPFEDRVGAKYYILVTDVSHDKEHFVGHNEFYEQVLIPKQDELMGKMVEVEIVQGTKFSMIGSVLDFNGSILTPNNIKPLKLGQVSGVKMLQPSVPRQKIVLLKWSIMFCLVALIVRMVQFIQF